MIPRNSPAPARCRPPAPPPIASRSKVICAAARRGSYRAPGAPASRCQLPVVPKRSHTEGAEEGERGVGGGGRQSDVLRHNATLFRIGLVSHSYVSHLYEMLYTCDTVRKGGGCVACRRGGGGRLFFTTFATFATFQLFGGGVRCSPATKG